MNRRMPSSSASVICVRPASRRARAMRRPTESLRLLVSRPSILPRSDHRTVGRAGRPPAPTGRGFRIAAREGGDRREDRADSACALFRGVDRSCPGRGRRNSRGPRPVGDDMTALAAAGRRVLPRGYVDFARQLVIWFGFLFAYQVARGFADRNPALAFQNGLKVIDLERHANALYELTFQRIVDSSHWLTVAAGWTYWNSEFTVVGLALLWVYLRRNESFTRFRNLILTANVIGLVGYVLLPTAPPRMYPDFGYSDTLDRFGTLNHGSGIIELAANPYAAMPSLHAADA